MHRNNFTDVVAVNPTVRNTEGVVSLVLVVLSLRCVVLASVHVCRFYGHESYGQI